MPISKIYPACPYPKYIRHAYIHASAEFFIYCQRSTQPAWPFSPRLHRPSLVVPLMLIDKEHDLSLLPSPQTQALEVNMNSIGGCNQIWIKGGPLFLTFGVA